MTVYVNGQPVMLAPGMRVKHAVIGAGVQGRNQAEFKAYDAWGNELGLDGAVFSGMKILVIRTR